MIAFSTESASSISSGRRVGASSSVSVWVRIASVGTAPLRMLAMTWSKSTDSALRLATRVASR